MVKMRKADYDMYYEYIEVRPNCVEAVRELERINLDKEREDGVQEGRLWRHDRHKGA